MIINSCYLAFSSYPRLPPNSLRNFHNSFSSILQQMNSRNAWRGKGFTFKHILRIKSCTQHLHSSLVKMIFLKKIYLFFITLVYNRQNMPIPYSLKLWMHYLKKRLWQFDTLNILKLEGDPGLSRWAQCTQVSL